MKALLLIIGFLMTQPITKFPERKEMLVRDFEAYENIFPLKILDLSHQGIKDKIHVFYVSFSYQGVEHDINFPKGEDMDHFTFKIEKDGLYRPTFRKEALEINPMYQPYFQQTKDKYRKITADDVQLLMMDEPEWLQNDATPLNAKGEKFKFICQYEAEILSNDDCWVYLFYDEKSKEVKYVYQRT
ncbi:MAG: hypothetical protein RLZZ500_2235 [Bacteroidota bacterium]|jgi:hypothetical protein